MAAYFAMRTSGNNVVWVTVRDTQSGTWCAFKMTPNEAGRKRSRAFPDVVSINRGFIFLPIPERERLG